MSRVKDFEETFKRYDQYLNGEISWSEFGMPGVRNRSLPMTMSDIDNIFGELGTHGEDRVFGASKFYRKSLHPSVSVKPKDVIDVELKKESCVINADNEEKKTENQLQIPKKPHEKEEIKEDWVVIENDDITDNEFEFC